MIAVAFQSQPLKRHRDHGDEIPKKALQRLRCKAIFACMSEGMPRSVKKLTDPRALRALAHPIRMSLLGLLRLEGPLTATRAAVMIRPSTMVMVPGNKNK